MATPESLYLLADVDGELAGSGFAGRSDLGGGVLIPRVLPEARRRGVGTALLRASAAHLEDVGYETAGSMVDDEGSLAFAERFGFRETGARSSRCARSARDEPRPRVPDGIELVSLAERPDLFRRTYDELALQAFEDMPTPVPISITPEIWEREWVSWPEGSFVALAGRRARRLRGTDPRRRPARPRREQPHRGAPRLARTRPRARAEGDRDRVGVRERPQRGLHVDADRQREHARRQREARLRHARRQHHGSSAAAAAVRRVDAEKLYYALEFFLATPTWVVTSLYLVSVLDLSPLQLVLMGTAMEATVFLCEIPTGIVADTYSRRLSLVIGYLGMGTSWLLVGVIDSPVAVIALWALWGVSYTFTSGAYEAWITDEVGIERVPNVFLRGARLAYAGSFVGLLTFVGIGAVSLRAAVHRERRGDDRLRARVRAPHAGDRLRASPPRQRQRRARAGRDGRQTARASCAASRCSCSCSASR